MLETGYKARLPRGWSYPVGAQSLSDVMEGVPGHKRQPLSFWDNVVRGGTNRQLRDSGHAYSIMAVHYGGPLSDDDREYALDRGEGAQWDIHVEAVPSDLAQPAKRAMESIVLPRLRRWLDASRFVDASVGPGFFEVLLDEIDKRLLIRSSAVAIGDIAEDVFELQPLAVAVEPALPADSGSR